MKIDFNFQRLKKSFRFAWQGVKHGFRREQNFRIELLAFILVIILGIVFKLDKLDWIWILLSSFTVLIAELLNSSLERLTDLIVNTRKTALARQAKDMAAAAVLIASMQALVAGSIVFGSKIYDLLWK